MVFFPATSDCFVVESASRSWGWLALVGCSTFGRTASSSGLISYIWVLCSDEFCYVKILVEVDVAGFSWLFCGGENCFIKVGVWGWPVSSGCSTVRKAAFTSRTWRCLVSVEVAAPGLGFAACWGWLAAWEYWGRLSYIAIVWNKYKKKPKTLFKIFSRKKGNSMYDIDLM